MVKSCFLVILLLLSTKSHTEDRCSDMADLRLLNCLAEHKFNYIIGGELVTLDRHLESVELAPNDPNFDLFRQFLNTQIKEVKLLMLNTFEDRAVSLKLDVIDGDLYHHGNLVDLGAFYNGGVAPNCIDKLSIEIQGAMQGHREGLLCLSSDGVLFVTPTKFTGLYGLAILAESVHLASDSKDERDTQPLHLEGSFIAMKGAVSLGDKEAVPAIICLDNGSNENIVYWKFWGGYRNFYELEPFDSYVVDSQLGSSVVFAKSLPDFFLNGAHLSVRAIGPGRALHNCDILLGRDAVVASLQEINFKEKTLRIKLK